MSLQFPSGGAGSVLAWSLKIWVTLVLVHESYDFISLYHVCGLTNIYPSCQAVNPNQADFNISVIS